MTFQVEMDKLIKEKRLYFLGDALPPDWYAAFKIWLPMAEAGDSKAQYNVGRCYNRGDGVDQNHLMAEHWYLKAAELNDPRALFNLYLFYSNGPEELKNIVKAEEYLIHAVSLEETRALNTIQSRKAELAKQERDRNFNLAKNDFLKVNNQICSVLAPLFLERKFEEAKKIIDEIRDERIAWVREYLDYTTLQIHIEYEDKKEERNQRGESKNYLGGEVYSWWRIYYARIKIKNESSKKLQIVFKDSSGKFPVYNGAFINGLESASTTLEGPKSMDSYMPVYGYIYGTNYKSDHNGSHEFLIEGIKVEFEKPKIYFGLVKPIIIQQRKETLLPGCFVLTACYGDENHKVVRSFREFRDQYLLTNKIGKRLVDIYYENGPKVAKFISNKPRAKKMLRIIFIIVEKFLPNNLNR